MSTSETIAFVAPSANFFLIASLAANFLPNARPIMTFIFPNTRLRTSLIDCGLSPRLSVAKLQELILIHLKCNNLAPHYSSLLPLSTYPFVGPMILYKFDTCQALEPHRQSEPTMFAFD